MSKSALLFAACVIGCALGADALAGASSSDASISANILGGSGIAIITPLVMPTIVAGGGSGSPQFAGTSPSLGLISADIAGNVKLTVGGQVDGMLVAGQPALYTILRNDGSPAVATSSLSGNGGVSAGPAYQLVGEGAQLGGSIIRGDALSVDIAQRINLASADQAVSGSDMGLLVVVVQYN